MVVYIHVYDRKVRLKSEKGVSTTCHDVLVKLFPLVHATPLYDIPFLYPDHNKKISLIAGIKRKGKGRKIANQLLSKCSMRMNMLPYLSKGIVTK